MGIARYLSKLASGLSSEGVVPAAKGGTGSTSGGGGGGPKISGATVTDSSYANLDDTAVALAGGYIKITGSGFETGCQVLVGTTPATSVTFISATEVRAQVPATTAGTYILYVVNTDGGTAIRVNGITFSATPTWTTESPLSGVVNSAISIQLAATGATTFSVAGGSSLPSGVSLSSGGLLSGTVTGISGSTTYNFNVLATDAELQDSPKTFALNISVGDAYFKYTTLLLAANGTNAAQNNTFVDSSTNNFTITRTGNVAQGTFSPYGSNWSNYFGGSNYLSLADNANLNPSTQDFVMEAWVFLTGTTGNNQGINGKGTPGTDGYTFFVTNALVLSFAWNGTGGATITGGTLVLNTWNHVAVVRNSSVIRLYLNGVDAGSSTACTTDITSTATKFVGQARGGNPILGYMSNYRMTKGSLPSGYDATSSTLTVPTTPLTAISGTSLLTCQSNRFVDNSTNNFTITVTGTPNVQRFNPFGASTAYSTSTIGGSGYFDGSGDYLTAPNNAAFNFGTGNFTVECWVYVKSFTGSTNVIISTYQDGSNGWTIGIVNNVFYGSVAGDSVEIYSSVTPQVNTWTHLALTRSSTTLSLFVNGVVAATQSNSTNMSTASALTIGTNVGGGSLNFTGYITDVRVVKGTAVYTSAFTPPTTPLTAVANTSVLTNFTNAGIIDSAMMNNAETVGNAQISTTQSKFGGSSMYFDGTGDYVSIPVTPNLQFGSGNFTIEAWIYPTNLGSYPLVAAQYGPNIYAFFFGLGPNDTKLGLYLYHAGGSVNVSTTNNVTLNTWNHVAAVRNGNTVTLYINGIAGGNVTYTQTVDNITVPISVGADSTGTYPFFGYIDDLRITKGYARYTANFTPSTGPAIPQ